MNKYTSKSELIKYALPPLCKDEERDLFLSIKKGDEEARENLFRHNIKLVIFLLDKYYDPCKRTSLTYEDLLQEGCFGLLKAIENNDVENDALFSTYAARWIMAYIRLAIDDKENIIHVPQSEMQKYRKYKNGLAVSGISLDHVKAIDDILYVDSLNVPVPVDESSEEGSELIIFVSQNSETIEDVYLKIELRETFEKIIDRFILTTYPNHEQKQIDTKFMIRAYYGLDSIGPLTLKEIEDVTNVKQNALYRRLKKFNEYCSIQPELKEYKITGKPVKISFRNKFKNKKAVI